jgi:hypothetical protein
MIETARNTGDPDLRPEDAIRGRERLLAHLPADAAAVIAAGRALRDRVGGASPLRRNALMTSSRLHRHAK